MVPNKYYKYEKKVLTFEKYPLLLLQLIHPIPAAGITYQRVLPGSTFTQEPEQSSSDLELTPRQQTLSGDEVRHCRFVKHLVIFRSSSVVVTTFWFVLPLTFFFLQGSVDNLMLSPMSEIITAIRENTEELADKIKLVQERRLLHVHLKNVFFSSLILD